MLNTLRIYAESANMDTYSMKIMTALMQAQVAISQALSTGGLESRDVALDVTSVGAKHPA